MLRAYLEGEFPLCFSAEKLLRFAASKKSSDKQPHFFEGAWPLHTHFQISTQEILSGVKKWIFCSQFCFVVVFIIIWRFVYCFRSAPMTFTSKALLFCCSSNVLVSSEMVFSCSATFLRRRNSFECCMCFAGTVAIKCGSRCTSTSLVLLSRSFLVML